MSDTDVNDGGSADPDRRRNKSGPIVFDNIAMN